MLWTMSYLDDLKMKCHLSGCIPWILWEALFSNTHVKILKSSCQFCFFYFTVQSESGCANVVSAAPCLAEPQQYEVQFGRLRNFLTGKSGSKEEESSWLLLSFQWVKGDIKQFKIMSLTMFWYFSKNRNI